MEKDRITKKEFDYDQWIDDEDEIIEEYDEYE